jgi:hypothetical protein
MTPFGRSFFFEGLRASGIYGLDQSREKAPVIGFSGGCASIDRLADHKLDTQLLEVVTLLLKIDARQRMVLEPA